MDRPELLGGFVGLEAPVIVACSGGPDSVALLVLAVRSGLAPVAVHVDHGIRADSADDAPVVAIVADRLGVEWRSVRVAVGGGGNLEARAREARYGALELVADELGATAILVGHTADDQAETVLLNLMRGSASAGIAGMAPRRGRIVRPLLELRRAVVRGVIDDLDLPTVDDPMNADRRFRRSWVRHELLPMLESGADRDLVPVLARQATVARAESDLLDMFGDRLLEAAGAPGEPAVAVLRDAPIAVARRALRRWVGPPPPSAAEIERIVAIVRGEIVGTELAGGRRIRRSGGRLYLDESDAVP